MGARSGHPPSAQANRRGRGVALVAGCDWLCQGDTHDYLQHVTGLNIVVANAGIDIGLEGYAQVSAAVTNNVCKVDMDLGVGITAGVSATAFGFDALDEDVTLFSKEVALLDNASCIPKLKNTATPN